MPKEKKLIDKYREEAEICLKKGDPNSVNTAIEIQNKIFKAKLASNHSKMKKEFDKLDDDKKYVYKSREDQYYLISISPNECNISNLISIINIMKTKREWLTIYSYVFEQRSEIENEIGKGKHIHLLTNKTNPPSWTLKYVYNSLNKYCQKESIDIKVIKKSDLKKTEKYMRGYKSNEKMKKVIIDRKWRETNNIKNIFVAKTFLTIEEIEEIERYVNGYNINAIKCNAEITVIDNIEYVIVTKPDGKIIKFLSSSCII